MTERAHDRWMARTGGRTPMNDEERLQQIKERADVGDSFTGQEMKFVYGAFQKKWDKMIDELYELYAQSSGVKWVPKVGEYDDGG